jgi:hypothetical protein
LGPRVRFVTREGDAAPPHPWETAGRGHGSAA